MSCQEGMWETISFQITYQFVHEPRPKKGVKLPSRRDAKSCQFVFMRKNRLELWHSTLLTGFRKVFMAYVELMWAVWEDEMLQHIWSRSIWAVSSELQPEFYLSVILTVCYQSDLLVLQSKVSCVLLNTIKLTLVLSIKHPPALLHCTI